MIDCIEDNAGGLFFWSAELQTGYDVTGVSKFGYGVSDMACMLRGETDDWTVPEIDETPMGETVATATESTIVLHLDRMGRAARDYFDVED